MIPVYVLTNDNHLWLLRGFSYLWNEFCDSSHQVTVVGYSQPDFPLPLNFRFLSLGKQRPVEEWSDSLIDFLDMIGHKYFILMLEDYWLIDYVDKLVANGLSKSMDDNTLRIDLSGNRLSYPHQKLGKTVYGTDLILSDKKAKYQMSFQAAIWHKENMLKVLRRGENPWQAEIMGSLRVKDLRVIGTNPAVMRYQPVWRGKQKRWHRLDRVPIGKLEVIRKKGWLENV